MKQRTNRKGLREFVNDLARAMAKLESRDPEKEGKILYQGARLQRTGDFKEIYSIIRMDIRNPSLKEYVGMAAESKVYGKPTIIVTTESQRLADTAARIAKENYYGGASVSIFCSIDEER